MGLYNLTRIERWHEDFTDLKNRFNNDYYQDFKSSYLRKCSNQLVSKMYLNLQEKYLKIRELYKKVDTVWSEYIVDLENTDNRLAGQSGSVSASAVSSLLSKMPQLNDTQYSLSNSEGQSKNAVLEIGEKILSTGAVVVTTVYSGLFKLREKFQDGALWLAATVTAPVVSLFNKEAGEKYKEAMMDAIAVDRVAEANKYFYENTKVGKYINEKSYLKYDSEFAKKMQDYSEKGFEIAAATALTVATGGLAAPASALLVVGTGFAVGAGEKAEENYQQADRSFYGDAGEIAFAGLIKGIEFYGEGKMGQGAINAASAIKSAGGVKNFLGGIKTALSNGESTLFTKESLKKGLKTIFKDVDTYMDSASAAIDNITYDNKNGIQVNWKELAKETACNFVMNFAFAFVGNAVERKMTSGMKNLELNANSAKSNPNIDSLKKEYDELLKESKEPWFVKAKEASDNGWAWDLNKVNEADSMVKRMNELEIALGIENTGIPEYKIHDYSQAKKEADAMVQEIKNKPIPGFENIDTNSPEYKKAMQEFYSKPSPSGKQDLSQVENPFNKKIHDVKKAYNVKKYDYPGGYGVFMEDMDTNRKMFRKIDEQVSTRELFANYSKEDTMLPGNYSAVNGLLRGTGIDFEKKTITISGSYMSTTYSFEDFEKNYKITVFDYYKKQKDATWRMIDTISEIPIGKDMRVVRGANWDVLNSYGIKSGDSADTILKKLQAKGTFTDYGFMSVCPYLSESDLPGIVTEKPIRFIMDIDADTRGIDMSEISSFGTSECELLLQNGLSFIPKSVEEVNGKIFIFMVKS